MIKKVNIPLLIFAYFFLFLLYRPLSYGDVEPISFYSYFSDNCSLRNINHIQQNISSSNFYSENLNLNWKYFETDHLKVIFPDYLYKFSLYVSNIAEDVYRRLSESTNFYPEKKIILLISTRGDSPNGYVTPGARGLYVTIFAIRPYEAINYGFDSYREWYRTLISHEFAHIFHIGEKRGFAKVASMVFGQIVYPNGLTPVFYREGFAVDFETSYNDGIGRAKSNYTEMYLRTAFNEDSNNSAIFIDRFSSRPRMWPFTEGCYLYGASFLEYLRVEHNKDILYKLNYDSSSFYYLPWVKAFKKETGDRVSNLWLKWLVDEDLKQSCNLDKIKQDNLTNFRSISPTKGYVYSVSLSNYGRFACYSISDGGKKSGLYIYDFQKRQNRLIKRDLICSKIIFSNDNTGDNSGLFYIREDYNRNEGWLKNLYYLNLQKLHEYKLTDVGHVVDFNFYNENMLLITRTTENGNKMYLAKLNRQRMRITFNDEILNVCKDYNNIESAIFSPDRSKIAFSVKDKNGVRSISIGNVKKINYNLKITTIRVLTGIPGSSYFPRWINDRFLAFINDGNGVYNLYLADLIGKRYYRITNLITGILNYDISNYGDVVGKIYSSEGFYVGSWSISDLKNRNYFEEGKFNIIELKISEHKGKGHVVNEAINKNSIVQKDYNSLKYLFPDYWVPLASGNGINLGIGFYTFNRDYIGRLDYSFAAVYDLIDSMFKISLLGEFNFPYFSLFGKNFFYSTNNIGNGYIKNTGFSFFYGIEKQIKRYEHLWLAKLGVLGDSPFAGVRSIAEYTSARVSYKWGIPYRGLIVTNDLYLELRYGKWLLNSVTFDSYLPLFRKSIFEIGGKILTDFGTKSGFVYIGSGLNYLYAPVNGINSIGYMNIKKGDIAFKENFALNVPLFQIERGIAVFPFYINNVYGTTRINLYEILNFSKNNNNICNYKNVIYWRLDDADCIRLSMDFSVNFNTTIFYDFPFTIKFGYVFAPLKGGVNGFYVSFTQN